VGSLIRGAALTLRRMGAAYLVKEALRRLTGRPYAYRGILIDNATAFRVARALAPAVWRQGDMVFFRGKFGTFAAPRLEMFSVFAEDLKGMYGALDVRDRTVADVGAYLGETAVFFARRGAKYVYAYEPVFYKYAEFNIGLNGVKAEVRPYGLGVEEDVLHVKPANTATGLAPGSLEMRVRPLAEALMQADAVKMDCEGCEWALLAVPCGAVRNAEEYVVEVHGPAPQLLRKMEKCGFKSKPLKSWTPLLSVWHFVKA